MEDKIMSNAAYGKKMDVVSKYPRPPFEACIIVRHFGESTGSIVVTANTPEMLGERLSAIVEALF